MYTMLDSKSLSQVTILGDQIPQQAMNYRVHCDQITLRLYSGLISNVTARSEGLFARLEGS